MRLPYFYLHKFVDFFYGRLVGKYTSSILQGEPRHQFQMELYSNLYKWPKTDGVTGAFFTPISGVITLPRGPTLYRLGRFPRPRHGCNAHADTGRVSAGGHPSGSTKEKWWAKPWTEEGGRFWRALDPPLGEFQLWPKEYTHSKIPTCPFKKEALFLKGKAKTSSNHDCSGDMFVFLGGSIWGLLWIRSGDRFLVELIGESPPRCTLLHGGKSSRCLYLEHLDVSGS